MAYMKATVAIFCVMQRDVFCFVSSCCAHKITTALKNTQRYKYSKTQQKLHSIALLLWLILYHERQATIPQNRTQH
jgi:hypothetical protein